jgi:lipopolysaccharide transport system ATP-binding protein
MPTPIISVNNLGKKYHLGATLSHDTMRDLLASGCHRFGSFLRGGKAHPYRKKEKNDELWALQDVSFDVHQGDTIGIIGRNGAGKSTLLKILSQITEPTLGEIRIRGRVASLLEVGTGFHPELSGKENIFLNGAILGMTRREIKDKFDEIVAFAEVERFIYTPVKRYSSGMYVRLAFAVAAHLEPEILLVDEVLAVGDASFQKKCLGKMGDVAKEGRTVFFVSHNMAAVRQLTKRCLLLRNGHLVSQGETPQIITHYLNDAQNRAVTTYELETKPRRYPDFHQEIKFLRLKLVNSTAPLLAADSPLRVQITLQGHQNVPSFRLSMTIFLVDGSPVGNFFGPEIHSIRKGQVASFEMEIDDLRLAPGMYYCAMGVGTGNHLKARKEFDVVFDVLHFQVLPEEAANATMSKWSTSWGPIRFKAPSVTQIA